MRELIIGDVHFGVKSNSTEWLTKQCNFINEQVTSIIKEKKLERIVFLGDLFDIRYSINQQVASEVKTCIRNLVLEAAKNNCIVIFIAGNHDYYSPLEESAKYNAYETVFGKEFTLIHPNVIFVCDDPVLIEDSLFLPWYWTDNTDHFDELLYRYKFGSEVKSVYCHADLSVWPGARITALRNVPVWSGHIHFISNDEQCNLYNIGASCALTFNDVNQDRFIYILEDYKVVEKIKNVTTPRFIRIYNEDIFSVYDEIFENSFVQLCINKKYIEQPKYIEQIKNLKNTYVNSNIRIHLIDDDEHNLQENSDINFSPNINEYISNNIPESLSNKFNIIKERYNTK